MPGGFDCDWLRLPIFIRFLRKLAHFGSFLQKGSSDWEVETAYASPNALHFSALLCQDKQANQKGCDDMHIAGEIKLANQFSPRCETQSDFVWQGRSLVCFDGSASMKHAVRVVNGLLGSLTVAIFTILVICVVWQVFSRFVLGTPSTSTDEIARFLFMWVAFMGAAYTLGQKRHLAIDIVSLWLEGKSLRNVRIVVFLIIGAFVSIVMIYGGWQLMMKTLASGQVTPALRIPMGYVYGAIPFSGATMLFYCIALIIELFELENQPETTAS